MTAHPPQNTDSKRRALGRGLESLLPSRPAAPPPRVPVEAHGQPLEIPLDRIDRNPYQTRTTFDPAKLTELAQSIAATGVVQPITVRARGDGRYTLINGERRLRASLEAGKATIPAVVREVSDEQAMEMTIVENLQRADLNPIEQARAYQRLSSEFRMTQEQMATRTGKDRASISNFLRLFRLPDVIQKRVELGELTFGHAKLLLALSSPQEMVDVAAKIVVNAMSVRQAETYISGLLNPETKKKLKVHEPRDPNVQQAQDLLQRKLGLRVRIEDKKGKGRVTIEYANVDGFDRLLSALGLDSF